MEYEGLGMTTGRPVGVETRDSSPAVGPSSVPGLSATTASSNALSGGRFLGTRTASRRDSVREQRSIWNVLL